MQMRLCIVKLGVVSSILYIVALGKSQGRDVAMYAKSC